MAPAAKKNIFVTGDPGAGKSTLVREAVRALGVRPGGYLTRAFPRRGRKIRCEIVSLTPGTGKRAGVLAAADRTGVLRLNPADLESVGAAALERAAGRSPLVVMDEIGHLESTSARFRKAVASCLQSAPPVLGALKSSPGPFVDRIKSRSDVLVLELSPARYPAVKREVIRLLRALLQTIAYNFSAARRRPRSLTNSIAQKGKEETATTISHSAALRGTVRKTRRRKGR